MTLKRFDCAVRNSGNKAPKIFTTEAVKKSPGLPFKAGAHGRVTRHGERVTLIASGFAEPPAKVPPILNQ
jgi:hypothetical protein